MKANERITDNSLIQLFFDRSESAISQTDSKYGRYIRSIAMNLLNDEEDSKECANDTLFVLWSHIPPDKPNCFKSYIAAIVRHAALERLKNRSREKRIPVGNIVNLDELAECLPANDSVGSTIDQNELKRLLNRFVKGLSKRKRYIFISRYYLFDSLDKIANALHTSPSTVSRDVAAIKKELKQELIKGGYFE